MNKVMETGRLTRDPEVRYINQQDGSQSAIVHFSIAVSKRQTRTVNGVEQTADFFNCTAFGKQGEFIEKNFSKGSAINICGRLQSGEYTTKEGSRVSTVEIIVEEAEFGESKASAEARNNAQAQATPQAQPQAQAQAQAQATPQAQPQAQAQAQPQPTPQAQPTPQPQAQPQPTPQAQPQVEEADDMDWY